MKSTVLWSNGPRLRDEHDVDVRLWSPGGITELSTADNKHFGRAALDAIPLVTRRQNTPARNAVGHAVENDVQRTAGESVYATHAHARTPKDSALGGHLSPDSHRVAPIDNAKTARRRRGVNTIIEFYTKSERRE